MKKMMKKTLGTTHVMVLTLRKKFTTKKHYEYSALSVILYRMYPVRAEPAFPPTQGVETRQLSRFLFNRFQLSSDARPQGAVYSTVLASLGPVYSTVLASLGRA